ncbi:MAG: HAMP domain-containing histidine kinase [Saprospiraceae bacterium]|nr:HAMP domain-containing histidine kinase [Saprospiraceae bacterium]
MDIYAQKSRWKLYLGIGGAVIVLISLVYTNFLTDKLAEEERNKANLYLMALEEISKEPKGSCIDCMDCMETALHLATIQANTSIPVILVGEKGEILDAVNLGSEDTLVWQKALQKMKDSGVEPLLGLDYALYYRESNILRQLRFFPLVQLLLIASFVAMGYIGFSTARRAEQNRVWVGMAKETAHQLGTPISAIMAWIEHLKGMLEENEGTEEVLQELHKDVNRLELIADRFSKIGSAPVLEAVNVYEELDLCRSYMQKRAPRKVQFDFPAPDAGDIRIPLNPPLFDWVIENLLRNALDAMEGKGSISAEILEEAGYVSIFIRDTGKGIPASKFKTIFQPGYSTKQRGWGLGLSLSKRIIEDYHKGKIFVKSSEEGKGATFCIQLPKTGVGVGIGHGA